MTGGEVVLLGMTMGELAMAAGSVVSAVGQLQAGANAQRAANFNAQVAFNNAHAVRLAAAEDGKRQDRVNRKLQGKNRAHDPDKLDLLEDNALEEELAVMSIIHGGEVQATGFENNARLEIARGKAAKRAGFTGAATSLLMGFSGPLDKMNLMGTSTSGAGGLVTNFNGGGASVFHPFKPSFSPILN